MDKKPKDFKQFDPKWAKKKYCQKNGDTMKIAGCAPTAVADIIAQFCDPSITPWIIAQLFMDKGFRKDGRGTLATCFKYMAVQYKGNGIKKFLKTTSMKTVRAALDAGALAIAHMGPGYWTNGGHYIVLWKCDGEYVYACDPGSSKRKKQALAPFKKQVKSGFYIYYPE